MLGGQPIYSTNCLFLSLILNFDNKNDSFDRRKNRF